MALSTTLSFKYIRIDSHNSIQQQPPYPLFSSSPQKLSSSSTYITLSDSGKWRNKVSFFQGFRSRGKRDVESLKKELLDTIEPLDRGAEASAEDQQRVDQIARKLEAVNPVMEPLKSDLLNGKWELLYTTSQSLLQTQATANLVPLNSRRVLVKFDFFKIASLIPIKSPGSGRGQLEITYLDQDLRISRGNRGNLFILKMVDPSYRVPL
ncbi:probable plastid-lipid-associated protein 4, chloroplastic isoform X2 [Arachis stenosperma]|uniref:probable plastid-lipid-associated protein 4, chloroplastic isoform X2 n=1 Tax=Arachis stenosperma TaxID=217475 RepID=UPI0025AD54CE|nr:probable plastid-lipid-associated protein 4, chloroplastic isoform X2 [Arachis stenosperma]